MWSDSPHLLDQTSLMTTLHDCLVPTQLTFLRDLVLTPFTSTVPACGQARRSGLSQRAGAAHSHSHSHPHSSSASSVLAPSASLLTRSLSTLLTSPSLFHRVVRRSCGRQLHSPPSEASQPHATPTSTELPHPSSFCRICLSLLCWPPQLRSPSSVSVKNAALSHRPLARSVHTNIVGLVGVVHSVDSVDFAVHRLQVVGQAICAGAAHLAVIERTGQR